MGRSKRKRNNISGGFVALTWELLNSAAYRELPYSGAKALPYFLGKVRGHGPERYDTEITFSYTEGQRYGFARATFSKAIQNLVRMGFIDPIDKGGLCSDGKSYNIFKLSRRWEKYGTDAFQPVDWGCFTPRPRTKKKQRASSKSESYKFKKGTEQGQKAGLNSLSEPVEGVFQ
jgi:hypothetical protein